MTDIPCWPRSFLEHGVNWILFPVGAPERATRLVREALARREEMAHAVWGTARKHARFDVPGRYMDVLYRFSAAEPPQALQFVDAGYSTIAARVARATLRVSMYQMLPGRCL